jgi:hypothetical protein
VLTIKVPKGVEHERSKKISIGGGSKKTIEGPSTKQSAIGKDWSRDSKEGPTQEQAQKDQDAPA